MISEDHAAAAGGVPTVVDQVSGWMAERGASVEILCARDDPMPPRAGVSVRRVAPSRLGGPWAWSSRLAPELTQVAERSDVVHVHGVWMAPQLLGCKAAQRARVPALVSFHAMLQPWFWSSGGVPGYIKKRAYWELLARPGFRHAACLHAITAAERDVLRGYFPRARIELIPNAIDLRAVGARDVSDASDDAEHYILFLGRIDRQKGVHKLVAAFEAARIPDHWRLVIAGPAGAPDYAAEVERQVRNATRRDRIDVIGPVFGDAKWRLLRRAWLLAVPSYVEVIGMVNLEGAACSTPTLTTAAAGLEGWEQGGGIIVDDAVDAIADALTAACAWSAAERRERGAAMRRHVESNYSASVVSDRWLELYRSVTHRGT